jgi:hypothetical protein
LFSPFFFVFLRYLRYLRLSAFWIGFDPANMNDSNIRQGIASLRIFLICALFRGVIS